MHQDSILRQDIQRVMLDAQHFQRILDTLEKDCEAWARECQENDLERGIKQLQSLGSDVSLMQADCVCLCHVCEEDEAWASLEVLRYAFTALNILYDDLKKLRAKLKKSYIHPVALNQLQIDWLKFGNTVKEIKRYLQYAEDYLKSQEDAPLSGEHQRVCWSEQIHENLN